MRIGSANAPVPQIAVDGQMNEHSGHSTSAWVSAGDRPEYPPLTSDIEVDVCVIGAGIAGLTIAYLLGKEGHRVAVLDDGPLGAGETERTTAHLSSALDERYFELERLHGAQGARLAAESHAAAIDLIERLVREERIDCDFARVDGYLFNPPGEPPDSLHRELAAAHRAGLNEVELVERAPLVSFNTGPALLFPHQAQFHPVHYLAGLALAFTRSGGLIFTDTHATHLSGGLRARVYTAGQHQVSCSAAVVATNTPVNDRIAIHARQRPYRTYVIGIAVPVGTVPKVLYWDTEDPYHYVRLEAANPTSTRPARDILLVGGEDHPTGSATDTEPRFERLERWTRDRFPMAAEVRYRWSGQIMEPFDGLALVGRNPMDDDNVYIATGDSGHGITHGTIAGMLITDLIQGRPNRWQKLYSPSRIVPQAAREYVTDNLDMATRYARWLSGGDVRDIAAIQPGCGAVVRQGLAKIAAYRDPAGRVHECSAVCPHLGGIVRWNDTEKTWDCPAHGSRFDALGHVLNGPANTDLRTVHATTH